MAQQVIEFVAAFIGIDRHHVEPRSTIFGDLRVDGADAVDLMEEFARQFHVDMTGYDHSRYFGTEGFNPVALLWTALRQLVGMTPEEAASVDSMRIEDLVAAAGEGRWSIAST